MKNKVLILLTVLILTANAGFCLPLAAKSAAIKFSLAMAGVALSSVLIFAGLSIYNKLRSGYMSNLSPEEEVLQTPKTKAEAIKFFIRKNRI